MSSDMNVLRNSLARSNTFAREEDYLGAFAEHVGDKPWKCVTPY